jgi:hypothetical protein
MVSIILRRYTADVMEKHVSLSPTQGDQKAFVSSNLSPYTNLVTAPGFLKYSIPNYILCLIILLCKPLLD